MKKIKDLDHLKEIVDDAKRRCIELFFHFDGTNTIYIYSNSDNKDDSTIEFDYEFSYFDFMAETLTKTYKMIPNLLWIEKKNTKTTFTKWHVFH